MKIALAVLAATSALTSLALAQTGPTEEASAPAQITMKEAPKGMYIFSGGKLSATNQAVSSAGTAISNANCDGVRWKVKWLDIEGSADNYVWKYLDDAVALAATNGKKCGIDINAGRDCPAWLYAAPYSAQSYTLQDTVVFGSSIGMRIPVPGDAVFMTRWQKFVADLGARYDSNPAVSFVIISGIGNHDEWNVADGFTDTAALGNTLAKVDAWKSSAKQIIDSYMTAFPGTTVMGYPRPPFNASNAAEDPISSMREVSDYATNTYNCRFAYAVPGLLRTTTASNSVPANELFLHWTTNTTHGETWTTSSSPDAFNALLHVALDLKIRGMEIYKADFQNATFQNFIVGSGSYAGEAGGITPRRAEMLAIPAPTPCASSADLKVTVADGKTTIAAGARDTYTIVVSNAGPSTVSGASVRDLFPATFTGVTFTATAAGGATGSTASGSGNINDVVTMPSGSKITYTAKGKLSSSASGVLSNTATVAAPQGADDPNTANNSATDSDTITSKADLKVTITDGKAAAVAGAKNTYTIVVTNAGPSNATGAVIRDNFPATFTGVTFTATQTGGATGFVASGTGNINDTVNMPAAAKITYKATGTIDASARGSISDTASVTSPSGVTDPHSRNNTATDTDTL